MKAMPMTYKISKVPGRNAYEASIGMRQYFAKETGTINFPSASEIEED